jgi:hypothetical protein
MQNYSSCSINDNEAQLSSARVSQHTGGTIKTSQCQIKHVTTKVYDGVEVVCSLDNCFGQFVYLTTSTFKIGKRLSVEH